MHRGAEQAQRYPGPQQGRAEQSTSCLRHVLAGTSHANTAQLPAGFLWWRHFKHLSMPPWCPRAPSSSFAPWHVPRLSNLPAPQVTDSVQPCPSHIIPCLHPIIWASPMKPLVSHQHIWLRLCIVLKLWLESECWVGLLKSWPAF